MIESQDGRPSAHNKYEKIPTVSMVHRVSVSGGQKSAVVIIVFRDLLSCTLLCLSLQAPS